MMNRLGNALLASVLLFSGTHFVTAEEWSWPVGLADLEEPTLHHAAMAKVAEFAGAFPGDPITNEAEALVTKDSAEADSFAWIGATERFVLRVLATHPPTRENRPIRDAALKLVDYPLHVDNHREPQGPLAQAWLQATKEHYQACLGPAIRALASTKVARGVQVWKLYNMGFVVRSPRHTVGFDVTSGIVKDLGSGPPLASLSNAEVASLARELDVLFLSHAHEDHVDGRMVRALLEQGKTVVYPSRAEAEIRKLIERTSLPAGMLGLDDQHQEPIDLGGVTVRCFAGGQGPDIPCNVYTVTLDGVTVSHNGDNTLTTAYEAITRYGKIDLLLANCWSGLNAYRRAAQPELVISGHENELVHPVSHRVAYLKTFAELAAEPEGPQALILHWGESLRYPGELSTAAEQLPPH